MIFEGKFKNGYFLDTMENGFELWWDSDLGKNVVIDEKKNRFDPKDFDFVYEHEEV